MTKTEMNTSRIQATRDPIAYHERKNQLIESMESEVKQLKAVIKVKDKTIAQLEERIRGFQALQSLRDGEGK